MCACGLQKLGNSLSHRKSGDSAVSRQSSMEDLYPPDPADAKDRKSILKNVAGFIIVTEFCERLAYYGFAGSLVLFFQVCHLSEDPFFI